MRFVIYGAGAVGSVVGARMHQSGADVVLLGRPAHVAAIRTAGLLLRTARAAERVDIPAVESLDELTPSDDDVVIITAKTQDAPPIHHAIAGWNRRAAIVCGTNGVEHERMALRRFERVYGMVIQSPTTFETAGEVAVLMGPTNALVDLGRYPQGVDDTAREVAAIIDGSEHLMSEADPHIMRKKASKMLLNLTNVSEAAVGLGARFEPVSKAAMEEGRAVLVAAGVELDDHDDVEHTRYKQRLATMKWEAPEGETFLGGSTWQGLAKGSNSMETDYFNGEIVLLGRLCGIPTPHNQFLQELADELLFARAQPGSMSKEDLDTRWRAATAPT